jgi:hypothetical protein
MIIPRAGRTCDSIPEPPGRRATGTASRASRPRAKAPRDAKRTEPTPPFFAGKVKINRTRVDVPMLVLRGDMAESHRLPIGATAFLSTDTRGDITLAHLGLKRPRKLRIVKADR